MHQWSLYAPYWDFSIYQKENRLCVINNMLECNNVDYDFMKKIITGDGTWVSDYLGTVISDKTSHLNEKYHSLPTKRGMTIAKQCQSHVDSFLQPPRQIHHEYAPEYETINKECYLTVLCCLWEGVRCKQLQLWQSGDWSIHHDSASAYMLQFIQTFLAKHSIT